MSLTFLDFNYRSVNLWDIALFLNVEYLATVAIFPKYLLFSLLQQENNSKAQGDYSYAVILTVNINNC